VTGIFFTARLASTRLAQKHLIKAGELTFIEWLVARFSSAFQQEIKAGNIQLFLTTSSREENKVFEKIFARSDMEIFYGSDDNIPLRHLECAKANNIDRIIAIDGDDILCSTYAAKLVLSALEQQADLAQSIGLPLGMNVSGYRREYLQRSLDKQRTKIKLETGWGRIFDQRDMVTIPVDGLKDVEELRMTLDYKEDALFFKTIIEYIGREILTMDDITLVNMILEKNWQRINSGVNEAYWINFNRQKQAEQ